MRPRRLNPRPLTKTMTRSNRFTMEEIDRPILEHTTEENPTETQDEDTDLSCTEIDVEEVAIDGICGVY